MAKEVAPSQQRFPLPHEPAASPVARYTTIFLGVCFLAVAVVTGHELWALTAQGRADQAWLTPVLDDVSTATYEPWMMPAGFVAIVVGFFMLYISIRPRTKTHRRFAGDVAVYTRPVDVARYCTAHAERVPGVLHAHTVATQRNVTVTISGDSNDPTLLQRVESTVAPAIAELEHQPTLRVKMSRKAA